MTCLPQALARLADLLSAPSHEDLVAYFLGEGEEPPELDRWGGVCVGQEAWGPSGQDAAVPADC